MTREMQIKTTMRYCVTPSRVAKVGMLDSTRFWKGYGAITTSLTVAGNVTWVTIMDCLRIRLINLFSMQFMRRCVGDCLQHRHMLSHHMPTSVHAPVYVCMYEFLPLSPITTEKL